MVNAQVHSINDKQIYYLFLICLLFSNFLSFSLKASKEEWEIKLWRKFADKRRKIDWIKEEERNYISSHHQFIVILLFRGEFFASIAFGGKFFKKLDLGFLWALACLWNWWLKYDCYIWCYCCKIMILSCIDVVGYVMLLCIDVVLGLWEYVLKLFYDCCCMMLWHTRGYYMCYDVEMICLDVL